MWLVAEDVGDHPLHIGERWVGEELAQLRVWNGEQFRSKEAPQRAKSRVKICRLLVVGEVCRVRRVLIALKVSVDVDLLKAAAHIEIEPNCLIESLCRLMECARKFSDLWRHVFKRLEVGLPLFDRRVNRGKIPGVTELYFGTFD